MLASPTLVALVHHTGSPAASRHFFSSSCGSFSGTWARLFLSGLGSLAPLASPTLLALVHHTASPVASRHFFSSPGCSFSGMVGSEP